MKIIESFEKPNPTLHTILDPGDFQDEATITRILKDSSVAVLDSLKSQVKDLIKLRNPSVTFTAKEMDEQVKDFLNKQGDGFGNWVYYPWKKTLVKVLPEKEFVEVRTVRNKYKITQEEQNLLFTKKIGIVGLSVGQSVALGLAMERVCGELRIADFDHVELGNLNRIRTSICHLGLKKTEIVRREIAEIDPYLKVSVFEEGLHKDNMEEFFTGEGELDLLVEECDSLPMKIQSRIKAKALQIPVIMDTSDRGMLDIERFDLEPNRPVFHGKLSGLGDEEGLLDSFALKEKQVLGAILDFDKLSPRAKSSIAEIGKSITNWPQLASSVIMGGGFCTHLAREILLGHQVKSGRFYVDLDEILK